MENAKTLNALDEFAKAKPKEIPRELDDYLRHVANTGDPVYQWSLVKFLFRQKLLNVIMEFFESCPMLDVPLSPNLDAFNFETIKKRLLERYDTFSGVPFTIQRIAELLTSPKKQYGRLDKYMRALEKNIWVVSTREAICREPLDSTNLVNGALPNVLHSNNVSVPPERLKRQSDAFDSEDDEDDLAEPEPEQPASEEQFTYETVAQPISELSGEAEHIEVSISADHTDAVLCTDQSVDIHEVHTIPTLSEQTTNNEVGEESVSDDVSSQTETTTAVEDVVAVADSSEEPETCTLTDESAPEVTDEKKKTEETIISVTGSNSDETNSDEVAEAPVVVEPLPDTLRVELREEDTKEKADLKRKIIEVIGEEEEVPNKKTDCPSTITEEPCVPEQVQLPEEIDTGSINSAVVEDDIEKVAEPILSVPAIVEVVEADCTAEVEGEMESTAFEEKTEMVVEEPDLSMDVDETSVQSPMIQEDAGEPMEAIEQGSI